MVWASRYPALYRETALALWSIGAAAGVAILPSGSITKVLQIKDKEVFP
jgi:hypothetical protein